MVAREKCGKVKTMATDTWNNVRPTKPSPVYCGGDKGPHFVFGDECGARFIAFHAELGDAINEFDERFGKRIEADDPDLKDYEPAEDCTEHQRGEPFARAMAACDAGEARMNDGGTVVWVSPYEWVREFSDAADAMRCFLGIECAKDGAL